MTRPPRLALSPENYELWRTHDPAARLQLCDRARNTLSKHKESHTWAELYAPDRKTLLADIRL